MKPFQENGQINSNLIAFNKGKQRFQWQRTLTHLKTSSALRRHQGTVISSLSSCTSSIGIVRVVTSETTAVRRMLRRPKRTGWRELSSGDRTLSSDTKWNTTCTYKNNKFPLIPRITCNHLILIIKQKTRANLSQIGMPAHVEIAEAWRF